MFRVPCAGAAFALRLCFLGAPFVAGCAPGHAINRVSSPTVEVTVRDVLARPIEASEPDAPEEGRASGDLVEVEWRGSWWPAVLLERRQAGWLVHYDGYSKDWDEVVTLERIRDRRAPEVETTLEPMDDDLDP